MKIVFHPMSSINFDEYVYNFTLTNLVTVILRLSCFFLSISYIHIYINSHHGRNYRTPSTTIFTHSSRVVHIHTWDIWSYTHAGCDCSYLTFLENLTNKVNVCLILVIPIKRGVRQGDPLSPRIFIAVLETIIENLNWKAVGLNINGKHISHLRFADDLVLLSENSEEIEHMICALQQASRQAGLEINFSKTKAMTNASKKQINVNNIPLEYVDSYIYLGKQVSFDNQSNEQEIERRIKGTWTKNWSLKEIFKSQAPI